jgi:capsular exopolysaccharide synthesis family protein
MAKESAWRSVQSGTLESLQVSTQGGALQGLVDRLTDAKQKLGELQASLGVKHPQYIAAARQISDLEKQLETARLNAARRVETEYRQALAREEMLRKEFLDTKAEFDLMNTRSLQYTALKREADADRGIYDELVRKIKEAGINAGFQNNTINLSDPARPSPGAVYPDIRSNLTAAFLFSLLLGMAAAIATDKLDYTIRDPQQAQLFLGAEVMASLPMVRDWKGKLIPANLNRADQSTALAERTKGPATGSITGFEEAIRTLRHSVLLSTSDHPLKSVMFTSAVASEGKTTIAVHFAIAHARQKHKTLLIDCDLRCPGVHSKLGVTPRTGLSTVLLNGLSWRETLIQFESAPGLTLLPAGPSSSQCAELIGGSLKQILAEAEREYDLIVVDSPPVLGFSEPLQMAAAVDGLLVVAVAGETSRKAVDAVLITLRRLHANVLGLVLNEVTSSTSDAYYYHGCYGTYYKGYRIQSLEDAK